MASRVNTRFVLILAGALGVIFAGVAGMLVVVKLKSGERYIVRGDRAMAAGNYKDANRFYSTAVNKDPQNVEWLHKAREALIRKVPETPQQYGEDFRYYIGLHRQLAIAQKKDVAAHRQYLDIVLALAELAQTRDSWDGLVSETESLLRYFDDRDGTEWQVLRRYRGLARMRLLAADVDLDSARIDEARQDLEIALAQDQGDALGAGAMAAWHRRQADQARTARDPDAERRHMQEAVATLDRAAAANPRDPAAVTTRLRFRADAALRSVDSGATAVAQVGARRAALDALKPALDEGFASLSAVDPATLDFTRVVEFFSAASLIDPARADRLTSDLLERGVAARPGAADLIYLQSRLDQLRDEHERAIARLQTIIDLPVPPVSLDGIRLFEYQKQAVFLQANSAIALASLAKAGPDRDAADRRAEKFRDDLKAAVAEEAPELLFVDGKRAFARGDLKTAAEKLAKHSSVTADRSDQSFEVLTIRGQIAAQFGQLGLAADLLERALVRRPESTQVRIALAEVQARLQHFDEALESYRLVLDQEPENAQARERYPIIQGLAGQSSTIADPVLQVLVEADRRARGSPGKPGDPDGAIQILERALGANNNDPRLHMQIVAIRLTDRDEPGARAALERGLRAHPTDEGLLGFQRQFDAASTVEGAIKANDEAEIAAVDKAARRYQIYRQYGKVAEADAALVAFVQQAPDDARAVEWQFLRALEKQDMEGAARQAERAQRLNVDGADGLTFLARLQIARQDPRAAVQTLQQAIAKGPENVATRRLLGQVLANLGRATEAEEAFKAALALNPADPESIKGLVAVLAQSKQIDRALAAAHESEQYARSDPDFLNMLYELEFMAGDRRIALAGRERLAARSPADTRNGAALARMYAEAQEWEKARVLIEKMRATQDSLALVGLHARWHADRGDMDSAKKTYIDYLEKIGREQEAPPTPQPYMEFGEFLLQRGDVDAGLAALVEATKIPSEKREAEVYLADRLASLGRQADAEQVYRSVLDAGTPDQDLQITARLVECLLQQGKVDDASQKITGAGAAADDSMALLVLSAAIAERRGDLRTAREKLNRAIERFPEQHLPYYRRALLFAADRAFVDDALADLDQCIRLRPDFWQALTTRADINFGRGREDEAFRDLRSASDANPAIEELRQALLIQLIRRGREQEASEVAQAGLKARPTDAGLAMRLGDLFAGSGLWNRSVPLYRQAWLIRRDALGAAGYVVALLRSTPPNLGEVETVLSDPAIPVASQPGMLMLRAILRAKQNQPQRAEADAIAAYALAVNDPRLLSSWNDGLREAWPDARARIQIFDKVGPRDPNPGWYHYFRAMTLASEETFRSQAIEALERVVTEYTDPALVLETCRALDTLYRGSGEVEKALAAAKRGLAANDRDVVLNNNAASYLAEKLGQPSEALPFALKAMQGAPANPTVLDTVAGVYIALKDWAKAQDVLGQGLKASQTPADKARFLLARVRVRAEAADRAGARDDAAELRRLLGDNPSALNDEQRATLDTLEQRIR